MSPWLRRALLLNVLLCVAFVFASYLQWELFNNNLYGANLVGGSWGPFSMTFTFYFYANDVVYDMVERRFHLYEYTIFAVLVLNNSKPDTTMVDYKK